MSWISEDVRDILDMGFATIVILAIVLAAIFVPDFGIPVLVSALLTYTIIRGPEKLRWFALGIVSVIVAFGLAIIITHWNELMWG